MPRCQVRDALMHRGPEALATRAERGARAPLDLPVFRGGGGVRAGVDLDSNDALLVTTDRDFARFPGLRRRHPLG